MPRLKGTPKPKQRVQSLCLAGSLRRVSPDLAQAARERQLKIALAKGYIEDKRDKRGKRKLNRTWKPKRNRTYVRVLFQRCLLDTRPKPSAVKKNPGA